MQQAIADIKAYLLTPRLPGILGSWRMRALFLVSAIMFAACTVLGASFSHERAQRRAEVAQIMPSTPRAPAEIRGLVNNMIRDHLRGLDNAPALIPQSMWDDAACAGAVIAMVNFLVGEEGYLRSTSAWDLERDNQGRIDLLYDREQSGDYHVDTNTQSIDETRDRTWWFSRLRRFVDIGQGSSRTSGRIYILGYRYKRTLANRKILEDRRQPGSESVRLNSHLVLLLGGMNGEWYGYHLFHDPQAPTASPFRVDALGSRYMTDRFDMVTVWEVRGPELTLAEAPIRMVNPAGPYTRVHPYLGWANRLGERAGSIFDTAMMGMFGDSRQFPHVERVERPRAPRRVIMTVAPTPSRPTARPQPRQHPLERRGKHGLAQVSRRNAPPPRVGVINQNRRNGEHHAQRTSPRR